MIGNRSAYRGEDYRLVQDCVWQGGASCGEAYGEKIMRGGDDNTELARTSGDPPPPLGVARVSI